MRALEAIIAWNPGAGDIKIDSGPDSSGWSSRFTYTSGACLATWHTATAEARIAMLFIAFNTAVVRDGLDPQRTHAAFLAIDEYRQCIAPDVQGADL